MLTTPLISEQGEDGLIFSDMEEVEEEIKTIPRQNTLQEFEANRQVSTVLQNRLRNFLIT